MARCIPIISSPMLTSIPAGYSNWKWGLSQIRTGAPLKRTNLFPYRLHHFPYPLHHQISDMHRLSFIIFLGILTLPSAAQTKISLNSDNPSIHWRLTPQTDADSVALFQPGYDTRQWTDAVVPGTTFTSFVAAGKEADPNYADNIYRVDKRKYDRNFWYRTEFASPVVSDGRRLWLHFRGITR